ncbi:MAG: hypothetical protein AB1805_16685 [Nitrospirota bacterium]
MDFPDDCTFIDYSILDVRKAEKKLRPYPPYIREEVVQELEKLNPELALHLRELLD